MLFDGQHASIFTHLAGIMVLLIFIGITVASIVYGIKLNRIWLFVTGILFGIFTFFTIVGFFWMRSTPTDKGLLNTTPVGADGMAKVHRTAPPEKTKGVLKKEAKARLRKLIPTPRTKSVKEVTDESNRQLQAIINGQKTQTKKGKTTK